MNPVHLDETPGPRELSAFDAALAGQRAATKRLVLEAMRSGSALESELQAIRVERGLTEVGEHLKMLLDLSTDLSNKRIGRKESAKKIRGEVVQIALHLARVKSAIGVDSGNSNQAQAAREKQAGEATAQAGTNQHG